MTQSYDQFIQRKSIAIQDSGFEPVNLDPDGHLFDWQRLIVEWAIRKGRAALFEDCGLGKTLQQLFWAQQVAAHTGLPVLIVAPLGVTMQTPAEGKRFGIEVNHCREAADVKLGINITNFDRLHLFDSIVFGGVVIDESSILKSFTGKMRRQITDRFRATPLRLCCTATPSPNDFTELGQHADFLGVCSPAEMLATYFINDTFDTGTWRLKGHAQESFWRWVSSWAVCISKPSDLGFSDEGFELPPLNITHVAVAVDETADSNGELFRNPDLSATSMNREMKLTINERCSEVVRVMADNPSDKWAVWCNLNPEQDELENQFTDQCVSVRGGDTEQEKESRELEWRCGATPIMVTKGQIFGMGMNWQHCANVIYFPNYSFERFYQAIRRFYRYGQKNPVNVFVVAPSTANKVVETIRVKSAQHDEMRELMKFTRETIMDGNQQPMKMNKAITSQSGEGWELFHGDCVRVAREVESNSIGFSVFSPPFADLFTYSDDVQDMGNCKGLPEFMQQFGFLIDQLERITMPGREVAVHCCDLLATKWKDGEIEFKDFSGEISNAFRSRGFLLHSRITIWKSPVTEMQRTKAHGLLYKTLCADSSKSRVGAPDYLLVFRKRGVNPKPIAHTPHDLPLDKWQELASPVWWTVNQGRVLNGEIARGDRDERHICPLQLDVIERALMLWSAKDDLVFSPFAGIGSEGFCSVKMGRRFIGAELKESYWNTACDNMRRAEEEKFTLFAPRDLELV